MDNSDKQMTMLLEEGGIADDGMNVDPVSGNEIPPGSLAEEVRDDVPAQLSEGEYVVPADVLRFYGVKFFEDLRSQAKQGLMDMEQNGRIGGEPVNAPAMQGEGDLTADEIAALASMGMAVGGMVPQPTQSTNPYLQQQQMYQQPAPVAMGNAGYNKGGLGMADTKANFDASYFARGADIDRILNPQVTQQPELKVVTLYGPGGEVMTLTLPVQQDLYDELVQQGYSEEQVVTTTETSVGVQDNDRGGEEPDTSPTGPSISEMSAEELGEAAKGLETMNTVASAISTFSPVVGLGIKGLSKAQENAINNRAEELGIESPFGKGSKNEGLLSSVISNITSIFSKDEPAISKSDTSTTNTSTSFSGSPQGPTAAQQAQAAAEAEIGLDAFGGDGDNSDGGGSTGDANAAGGANASGPSASSAGPSGNAGESEAATGGVGDVGLGSGPMGLNEGGMVKRPKKSKKK